MADKSVPLLNPNDGLTGRDGGPYLDQEEQRIAEERRARIEGRKPNFDNPGATAGVQLRTAADIIHHGVHNVVMPSQTENQRTYDVLVDAALKDKETPYKATSHINVSERDRLVEDEKKRQDAPEVVDSEDVDGDFNPDTV